MAKNCPWLSVPAQLSMIDDDDEPPIDFFLFIISLSLLERVKRQTNNLFKTIKLYFRKTEVDNVVRFRTLKSLFVNKFSNHSCELSNVLKANNSLT